MQTCHAGHQQQLEVHLLDPETLQFRSRSQLLSNCTAAAISPNGCSLAAVHQTLDSDLASLKNASSPSLHALTEGQQHAGPQGAGPHSPLGSDGAAPMVVDLSEGQQPLRTSAAGAQGLRQSPEGAAAEGNRQAVDMLSTGMVDTQQQLGGALVDMLPWATETTVSFSVLLPEASCVVQSIQGPSPVMDDLVKDEDEQATPDGDTVAVQVKAEDDSGAADVNGLQLLSDALVDR